MQVHLHADLVYLFLPITGIPIHSTTSLVNKLETPIHTHTHIYDMVRLANNGNINFATNIYRLMRSTRKEWLSP